MVASVLVGKKKINSQRKEGIEGKEYRKTGGTCERRKIKRRREEEYHEREKEIERQKRCIIGSIVIWGKKSQKSGTLTHKYVCFLVLSVS